MKKVEILLTASTVILCSIAVWYAFGYSDYDMETLIASPTTVRFDRDSLQLGAVKYGTSRKATFRFINTGVFPLIIRDVQSTCGCTSIKWGKHPVKPGESGEISVTFDPNSLGKFTKTLQVLCNVKEKVIHLRLHGSVIE